LASVSHSIISSASVIEAKIKRLQRSEPRTGALFILRQVVGSRHTARSLDDGVAKDRQPAALRIAGAPSPIALRVGARFALPVALSLATPHAAEATAFPMAFQLASATDTPSMRDTALVVAYRDTDLDLQLPCLGDRTINDLFSFGEFQNHEHFPVRKSPDRARKPDKF
jgi:hypothetical protein